MALEILVKNLLNLSKLTELKHIQQISARMWFHKLQPAHISAALMWLATY